MEATEKNFNTKVNKTAIIKSVEQKFLKQNLPNLRIGDIVRVGLKIKEGNKERVQFFEGLIIRKKNTGINSNITVRRVFQGIGIERIILVHSPRVDSIKIIRSSKVRRAKLYYIRNLSGKAAKLKQRFD
jgi:large subunit ribosomal protein L19